MTGVVRILFIVNVALILLASLWAPSHLWGSSAWAGVSFTLAVSLAAVFALLIPMRTGCKAGEMISGRGSDRARAFAAAFAAAALLMWAFRSGHRFWGDGISLSSLLERGEWLKPGAPLATAYNQAMHTFVNSLFFSGPAVSIPLASIVCGLLFIIVSSSIARLHGDGEETRSGTRFLSALFIAANGYFVVFLGAGGNAAPSILVSSLFILAALYNIRGRTGVFAPLALFALAFFTHPSAIFLLPGALLLIARAVRGAASPARPAAAVLVVAAAWLALDLALGRYAGAPGPTGYMLRSLGDRLGNAAPAGAGNLPALWANELLILGPSALTAAALAFRRNKRNAADSADSGGEERFLLLLVVSAALFIFAGAGRVEDGLRWDIFAAAGPVFAVFSLWKLGSLLPARRDFVWALVLLSAAGIMQVIPLAAAGSSANYGRERLLALPLDAGSAENIMGLRAMESKDYDGAAEWFTRATGKAPENDLFWFALGQASLKREDYVEAVTDFMKALKLKPGDRAYSENLVEAYIGQRWFEEAADELGRLIGADSTNAAWWTKLGFAMNNSGRYEEAVGAYERAFSLEPGSREHATNLASALLNKGAELHEEKRFDEAAEYYDRVLAILPDNWIAMNNRATLAMDTGDLEYAHRILERALEMNPLSPNLHYNMGLVQEKRGNYAEAFEHLKQASELNPNVPPPSDDLERVYLKLKGAGGAK
ncbi:MAG: tetratricopeptide repeat protein [Candidatus Krumholzibacteria bacterium]|jgi:tetratricopeptide (TPR) repeat protein|nr:tetratricopeptide repeat protein [Candidatus Krumholzibacteria bacterium]